ncbi:hypothetical protein QTP88_008905 [Uroleucon formosanum]
MNSLLNLHLRSRHSSCGARAVWIDKKSIFKMSYVITKKIVYYNLKIAIQIKYQMGMILLHKQVK